MLHCIHKHTPVTSCAISTLFRNISKIIKKHYVPKELRDQPVSGDNGATDAVIGTGLHLEKIKKCIVTP